MLGKVAIVTGSSIGIGRATAILLASKGCKVVITGRNADTLEEAFEEILKKGGSTPKDVLKLVGDLHEKIFLEEIINNAGQIYVDMTGKEGFEQPVEVLQQNMDINVKCPMYLTQLCFPHLKETKGTVVFNSSFLSLAPHGVVSMPYYGIAKATMDHMARAMALEYIKSGVRVNMVNPGLISTTFFNRLGVSLEKVRKMEEYVAANPIWIPVGRVGTPEDVASAMVFLADNSQSSYIVGQSIPICGGASICMGLDTSDYKTPLLG